MWCNHVGAINNSHFQVMKDVAMTAAIAMTEASAAVITVNHHKRQNDRENVYPLLGVNA